MYLFLQNYVYFDKFLNISVSFEDIIKPLVKCTGKCNDGKENNIEIRQKHIYFLNVMKVVL